MSASNSSAALSLYNPPATPTPEATPADHTEQKSRKPYPEFPLYVHRGTGQWCKRIRGKLRYFGNDADKALAKYLKQKDALHAGEVPKPDHDEITVNYLITAFLNFKRAFVESGELSPRTFADYDAVAGLLSKHFGKRCPVVSLRPDDFTALRKKLAKRWGPVRLGNTIQRIRTIFKWGADPEVALIERPMRFGPGFRRPTRKTMRQHRAKQGLKLFTADEIKALLDVAGMPMKAMILLGINCGFGNSDAANLPMATLDLDGGSIEYPRPKTGIPRKCLLWPETVEALREAIGKRPEPKDPADARLVFLTQRGYSWSKDIADSPITKEMRKLLDKLGIDGHRNFYTLRHTFRTVADESRDQPAIDHVMGHESPHMSSVYRERISDERLRAVADYVRGWLFGPAGSAN